MKPTLSKRDEATLAGLLQELKRLTPEAAGAEHMRMNRHRIDVIRKSMGEPKQKK
jgi:hypothetical protein